jgi:Ribonucleotide reductase, barrel domain
MTNVDSNLFQVNNRLHQALLNKENYGFSCNFYSVPDSIKGINEAKAWSTNISVNSGAPSLDFSHLRPNGSSIRRGGATRGVIPFMEAFDASCRSCIREHNKNHAMLIGLDITHDDFFAFLEHKFPMASKVVYLTKGLPVPEDRLAALYNQYKTQPKLFIHKRKANPFDPHLPGITGTNLCTEILDMETKDTCILGSWNIAQAIPGLELPDFHDLGNIIYECASNLIRIDQQIKALNYDNPDYHDLVSFGSNNNQVGLSMVGLATLLGRLGKTYDDNEFLSLLTAAYDYAARQIKYKFPQYKRVFAQAPTVHSHLRFTDPYTRLAISPSIEPVIGISAADRVLSNVTSTVNGNRIIEHPRSTLTVYDVPFQAYARFTSLLQHTFDRTGLAQTISFSVYNIEDGTSEFTYEQFMMLLNPSCPVRSLYYYIPVTYFGDDLLEAKQADDEIILSCDFSSFSSMSTDQCDCAG